MVRDPKIAIIDFRYVQTRISALGTMSEKLMEVVGRFGGDEERICDANIVVSHHYSSDDFMERLPEIVEATRARKPSSFTVPLARYPLLPPPSEFRSCNC
jgi:hypothetical protein